MLVCLFADEVSNTLLIRIMPFITRFLIVHYTASTAYDFKKDKS